MGAPQELVDLASQAALDEADHASRCRDIVVSLQSKVSLDSRAIVGNERVDCPQESGTSPQHVPLGGPELSEEERALYTSVAACCITETLATALLVEIRKHVREEPIAATVKKILKDEVNHARLGWAHLAWAAPRTDVQWLASRLSAMFRAALPECDELTGTSDLIGYGILPPKLGREVVSTTFEGVIRPGFARYGLGFADDPR